MRQSNDCAQPFKLTCSILPQMMHTPHGRPPPGLPITGKLDVPSDEESGDDGEQ